MIIPVIFIRLALLIAIQCVLGGGTPTCPHEAGPFRTEFSADVKEANNATMCDDIPRISEKFLRMSGKDLLTCENDTHRYTIAIDLAKNVPENAASERFDVNVARFGRREECITLRKGQVVELKTICKRNGSYFLVAMEVDSISDLGNLIPSINSNLAMSVVSRATYRIDNHSISFMVMSSADNGTTNSQNQIKMCDSAAGKLSRDAQGFLHAIIITVGIVSVLGCCLLCCKQHRTNSAKNPNSNNTKA